MARPPKEERNKDLVLKRVKNPKRWGYRALSAHFHIDTRAVWEIVQRDLKKFATPAQVKRYKGLLRLSTGRHLTNVEETR